jgi:hypothetical protein
MLRFLAGNELLGFENVRPVLRLPNFAVEFTEYKMFHPLDSWEAPIIPMIPTAGVPEVW